ncbi:hypothetical protein ACJX0J_001913, partial (mitochondrion) [Zea mays]
MLLTHSFNAMAEQKDGPLLAMLTWDSIIRLIAIGLSGQRAGMPGNGNWQFAEILKGRTSRYLFLPHSFFVRENPILHSSPSIPNKKPILLPNYTILLILFSFLDDAQEMVRIAQDTSFSLGNIKHIFAKINILLSSRMLGDLRDDPIRDPVIDTIYEGADYPHNEFLSRKLNAITQFVWGMFNILFGTGMVTFLINKDIVNTVLILPRTWIIIKNLEEDLQAYSNKLSTHFSRLLPFWSKRMQSGSNPTWGDLIHSEFELIVIAFLTLHLPVTFVVQNEAFNWLKRTAHNGDIIDIRMYNLPVLPPELRPIVYRSGDKLSIV